MKRKLTIALLLILCSSLLYGCKGNNEKIKDNLQTGESPSASVEVPEKEQPEEKNDESRPAPVDVNLTEAMSDAEKRVINTFISNFTEAYCDELGYGVEYYDYKRINFAYIHNMINNPDQKIMYNEILGKFGISEELVDSTLEKFFGETVPHKTASCVYSYEVDGKIVENETAFEYTDGVFWCPAASGESYERFAIVTDMRDNGDGTFAVKFNEYRDEAHMHQGAQPEWYSYTPEEAEANCTFVSSGTAKVSKKNYDGEDTYELISFKSEK